MIRVLPPVTVTAPHDAKIASGTQWDFYYATRGIFAGKTPLLTTIRAFAVLVGVAEVQGSGIAHHLYGVKE